ncbi:TetR/AcrR family transcriptional regulator [Planobispora takensis]|uniref:TetR family transcriptional regulator n=1 Tax=Planobispora takensis TaxID=1367882 RepID=A0A8J3SW04_9ACTN|nr:TetR/AcrR family transcriptional regulator [Planobispora takensis]GII00350.1 TetR family transcriptional regulator [Planobispora takensis]
MTAEHPARRPGGRTARVRAAVHQAVIDLLHEEGWDDLNVALVAERSGVHQTTIYRRWGTLAGLIDDVVTERLTRSSPVPDTGTLRGDLEAYALQVADDVSGPLGPVFVRAAMIGTRDGEETTPRQIYLLERAVQLQAMLDRARDRGENPPTLLELMEIVQAPLYFHAIFFGRPAGTDHTLTLVDRLLALTGKS